MLDVFTVLVCGSRYWYRPDMIRKRLTQLPHDTLVIHGGARGADEQAGEIARSLGFVVTVYVAHWDKHGKGAGMRRNLQMLKQQPNLVLAFQRDGSKGTQHVIDEARKRGIPLEVFTS